MSRTDFLCRYLQWTGLLALATWTLPRRRQQTLTVLAYHRVCDLPTNSFLFDPGVVSCSPSAFEQHMRFVRRWFQVVTFQNLEVCRPTKRPPLVITFDDGYRDNAEVAAPVLQRLGLRAVFFVSTAYMDGTDFPWWDEITWRIWTAKRSRLDVPADAGGRWYIQSDPSKERAISRLLQIAKRLPNQRRLELIHALRAQSEPLPEEQRRQLLMDWDAVRALAASGMEIGSHTVTHPLLNRLGSPEEVRFELEESYRRIARETGLPPRALAYPVGRRSGVSEATVAIAQQIGYRYGCLYEHGLNSLRDLDALRLRRLRIERGDNGVRFRAKVACPSWIRY